jgi:hypothetical protein
MSIENAAEKYLNQLIKENYEAIKSPKPEMVAVAETFVIENVILVRDCEPREPQYFAGVKRNGNYVWTHDVKLARKVSEDRIHLYEEKLGETLLPMWPYQR